MQVSVESISTLERRLTVGIPAAEVDKEVEKRIKAAAGKVTLNGFRKGKVPLKVVKQRFGSDIRNEVLGEVINRSYFEAVQKEDLKPAGMPNIDTKVNREGQDLEYIATFEVYPDFELIDCSDFDITRLTASVTDADVDKTIDTLLEQNSHWHAVERAAQDGDQVTIDFNGRKDGEEFAGGKAEQHQLVLGSKQMIPGFEAGIVGMQTGEEKVLELTFPDDYHAEELRGAVVEFTIKLHGVEEKHAAHLNEEFFQKFGLEEGGEEAFRAEVKSNMERELNNGQRNKIKNQVLDLLYAKQPVEIPAALMAREINTLRQQMVQQFGAAGQNRDFSELLPDTMFEEQAKKRVALGLIINEFITRYELTPDEDKVKERVEELAGTYDDSQAVIQYYNTNAEAKASVEAMVLEDQVIDQILSIAKVTDKPSTYEDVLKQDEPRSPEAAGDEDETGE